MKLKIEILDNILTQIFPPKCGICDKISKNYLCPKCEKILEKEALFEEEHIKENYFLRKHIYIFKYGGVIRKKLLNYKFNESPYLYKTFTNFIYKYKNKINLENYDYIIPVPISKKRLKTRGYNQSELIAKQIAKMMNTNFNTTILIKIKDNKAQSTLDQKQRQENAKNAYLVANKNKILNAKILLVDDIFTTGATARECAKALKNEGAAQVDIFTLAKD